MISSKIFVCVRVFRPCASDWFEVGGALLEKDITYLLYSNLKYINIQYIISISMDQSEFTS